ncbi:Hypothetical protein A7982_00382 [Minicystis rosea]|nr:Hypothetical protein A7982_00382 [Minicystis rosea]
MRLARAAIATVPILFTAAAHAAPPALPVPNLALTVTTPSVRGPWTLRLVNEGKIPLRVAADARLLHFSITPPAPDAKPITCRIPHPLRPRMSPDQRRLYLAPGHAYEESIDPLLFCFGNREAAALVPGALVQAFLGGPKEPVIVEDLAFPSEVASLRELAAPTTNIGLGIAGDEHPSKTGGSTPVQSSRGDEQPSQTDLAVIDERAPRLELEAPRFVDAQSPRTLVVRFVARNAGHRPMRVALRQRMLSFLVDGPTGTFRCESPQNARDATPPDSFRTLAPGAAVPLAVRLDEVCTHDDFRRPGLYRVSATLNALDTGAAHGIRAYTGVVPAERTTLVRLLSAAEPFYPTPPEAKPLATPEP